MRFIKRLSEERSQAIIMFVGMFSVIMAIGAITIDVGIWFAQRQRAERAADLAALAGSQSLLRHTNRTDLVDDPFFPGRPQIQWWQWDEANALQDACTWAARNGYDPQSSAVDVHLSCTGKGQGLTGICQSPQPYCSTYPHPRPCPSLSDGQDPVDWVTVPGCDSISVTVQQSSTLLFSSLFHVSGSMIGHASSAGETVQAIPLDVVLVIDHSGSMIQSQNYSHGHSRLYWAKRAALTFVNELAGGSTSATFGSSHVEVITFEEDPTSTRVLAFTNNATTARNAINNISENYDQNTDTRIAPALAMATSDLNAHVHKDSQRVVILLSDGRNCGFTCTQTHQWRADTENAIPALDAATKSVFTIGVGDETTCGPNHDQLCSADSCNSGELDHYLLVDIAKDPGGYTNTEDASNLPTVFQQIAWAITGRSLTQ